MVTYRYRTVWSVGMEWEISLYERLTSTDLVNVAARFVEARPGGASSRIDVEAFRIATRQCHRIRIATFLSLSLSESHFEVHQQGQALTTRIIATQYSCQIMPDRFPRVHLFERPCHEPRTQGKAFTQLQCCQMAGMCSQYRKRQIIWERYSRERSACTQLLPLSKEME